LAGGRVLNTSIVDSMSLRSTAVPLDYDSGSFFLEQDGRKYRCNPVHQPAFLSTPSGFGGNWSDYLLMHSPNTLFATPLRGCVFAAEGQICKFCTFEEGPMAPIPPKALAAAIKATADELEHDFDLALGSGTPNRQDHGVRYFEKIAREVLSQVCCGISVECVPPHSLDDLSRLRDAGTSALIMSIEIWDDAKRAELCPGKSYVSKEHYLRGWKRAIELLGPGTVSSVLLVGLDEVTSLKEGIKGLIDIGVIPTVIPFRPYDNTPLSSFPLTDAQEYLDCAEFNAQTLFRAGLTPYRQRGCTSCQGCSIDAPEDWGMTAALQKPGSLLRGDPTGES
jgi:hypothetical protein